MNKAKYLSVTLSRAQIRIGLPVRKGLHVVFDAAYALRQFAEMKLQRTAVSKVQRLTHRHLLPTPATPSFRLKVSHKNQICCLLLRISPTYLRRNDLHVSIFKLFIRAARSTHSYH